MLASAAMDASSSSRICSARGEASGRLYHEFVRTHDLSVGLYVLPAGGRIRSSRTPRTRSTTWSRAGPGSRSATRIRPCRAGSIVFVGADVPHRFHDIEEELVVLVVFGPAEYTSGRRPPRALSRPGRRGRGAAELAAPAPPRARPDRGGRTRRRRRRRRGTAAIRPPTARASAGVVVVPPQPQVQERAGPSDRRRLVVLGELGRAERRAGRRRAPRTSRRRATTGPGARSTSGGRAARPPGTRPGASAPRGADAIRDAEQDRAEPLAEAAQRLGQPGDARLGRLRSDRHGRPRWAFTANRNSGGVAGASRRSPTAVGRRRNVALSSTAASRERVVARGGPAAASPAG